MRRAGHRDRRRVRRAGPRCAVRRRGDVRRGAAGRRPRPRPTSTPRRCSTRRAAPGADAVHPGLRLPVRERRASREAVLDAGLVWVGPTPESMRAMARKVEAKRIAADAGVPLVPGAELPRRRERRRAARASRAGVGYPVLVKASAGGGGKGMRIVRDAGRPARGGGRGAARGAGVVRRPHGVPRALRRAGRATSRCRSSATPTATSCTSSSASARSSAATRRSSRSRRRPARRTATLERMYAAALALARAIGYVGAGTVEFLVSGDGPRAGVLLPRDEHPPAGRAPRDRGGHRARPRRVADRGRARRAAAARAGRDRARRARDRGPALRRGPGPRLPPQHRGARVVGPRRRRGLAADRQRVRAGRRRLARTTTPCSRRSSHGATPGRTPRAGSRRTCATSPCSA